MRLVTLIPAYKTRYLVDLFSSLLHQSHRPDLIILSDDSPNASYTAQLRSEQIAPRLAGLNLQIVQGPRRGSSYANVRHLLDTWAGESDLVHLMFDDDILYPDFYERHLVAHRSGRFGCSVSRRWSALESGHPVGRLPIPPVLTDHPNRLIALGPELLFPTTVPHCSNWLGEFSNSVMRSELHPLLQRAELHGISFEGLEDIGMVLAASERGPVCFLNETLGSFRHGPDQNTAQLHAPVMMKAHLAWAALAIAARRHGRLSAEQAAAGIGHLGKLLDARYAGEARMDGFRRQVHALLEGGEGAASDFLASWQDFVAMH
jgi:hypothetical protein